jgi:dienelactone hydrolase
MHRVRNILINLLALGLLLNAVPPAFAERTQAANRNASRSLSSPEGVWYVNANSFLLTIVINSELSGTLTPEGGAPETLEHVAWDAARGVLEFRRSLAPDYQWYRVEIADGLLIGRYTHLPQAERPANRYAYQWHITGWHASLGAALAPRVYDFNANGFLARLRLDRQPGQEGRFQGRLKFYARENIRNNDFNYNEYLEEEVTINTWDGAALSFTRGAQVYTGRVDGRRIAGSFTYENRAYAWSGMQAEVLSYGLAAKTPAERAAWEAVTRRRVQRLTMAGNPLPERTLLFKKQTGLAPLAAASLPGERDDNPQAWAQNYTLTEYELGFELPNPFGGAPLMREARARLAVPNAPRFGGGKLPLVVALNGHGGDAEILFNPADQTFWYGDAYARRGYAVLAVDITHRPVRDRVYFPGRPHLGDDLGQIIEPGAGDHTGHSNANSIKPARAELLAAGVPENEHRLFTDWEEDGERAWTVLRVLDWLLANSDVQLDPARIMVTGISMGGELTTYLAALDPRIALAVPSGFSPDLSVLKYRESHGCWNWAFADIREYLDAADLFALVAPRPLIIQSGKLDEVYSGYTTLPEAEAVRILREEGYSKRYVDSLRLFAADKEVARRVRAAYAEAPANFVHNLHYDGHLYHFGDLFAQAGAGVTIVPSGAKFSEGRVRFPQRGLTTPLTLGPEQSADWQTDGRLTTDGRTLTDYVEGFLNLKSGN